MSRCDRCDTLLLHSGRQAWKPMRGYNTRLWLRGDRDVVAPGGLVSGVADQSGNAQDATQSSGANQPSYSATALAGKPGVVFDGTSKWLEIADSVTLRPSVWTLVIVCSRSAYVGYANVVSKVTNATWNDGFAVGNGNGTATDEVRGWSNAYASTFVSTTTGLNTARILTMRFDGTNLKLWKNGTAIGSIGASFTASTNKLYIGAGSNTGGVAGYFWSGAVGEVILLGEAPNDTDVDALNAGVNRYWGLY